MKNKIKILSVLILSMVWGFSTNSFAAAEVAELKQEMQEMERKQAQELSVMRENFNHKIETILPVGTILIWSQNSNGTAGIAETMVGKPEEHLLLCNGASLSRSKYPALFAAIGTAFGSKDGNSFNLPDFRGRFLRGVDGSAGNDPDKASRTAMIAGGNQGNAVGSIQADQFTSHLHKQNYGGNQMATGSGGSGPTTSTSVNLGGGAAENGGARNRTVTDSTGGNETRPKNAFVNFVIKY